MKGIRVRRRSTFLAFGDVPKAALSASSLFLGCLSEPLESRNPHTPLTQPPMTAPSSSSNRQETATPPLHGENNQATRLSSTEQAGAESSGTDPRRSTNRGGAPRRRTAATSPTNTSSQQRAFDAHMPPLHPNGCADARPDDPSRMSLIGLLAQGIQHQHRPTGGREGIEPGRIPLRDLCAILGEALRVGVSPDDGFGDDASGDEDDTLYE